MAQDKPIVGVHKDSEEIVPIYRVVDVGLRCNCNCFDCGGALEAVIKTKRKRHFRHSNKSNCKPSPETQLHLLAKDIILKNNAIYFPGKGIVDYSSPVCETRCNDLIPDATIQINGVETYIEIVVTNPIDSLKFQKYKTENSPVLVINLKEEDRNIDYSALAKLVLQVKTNKTILIYQYGIPKVKEQDKAFPWKLVLGIALGVAILWNKFLRPFLRNSIAANRYQKKNFRRRY